MARAIWNGTVGFGLVQIPVGLYSAEAPNELDLTLLDKRDFSPIGYERINKKTKKEVAWDNIVKGYEHGDGEYVVLTDADFEQANVEAAEFQRILDFPPAEKLGLDGRLDPEKATAAELRGQDIFFGKGKCASCHTPPYYTDNSMHALELERFYDPRPINGILATAEGPIKTFPLRGLKDSPPYLHDGRLLTIEDTIEFFNLVLGTGLNAREKQDLRAFLYAL